MWTHTQVWVQMHVGVHACEGPKLDVGVIHDCSSTLFIEAEFLNRTQSLQYS